jgi:hypothetical protein
MENVACELAVEKLRARVTKITGQAYGGRAQGEVQADLNDPLIAHSGELTATGVDGNRLVTAILGYQDVLYFTAEGSVKWTGRGYTTEAISKYWEAQVKGKTTEGYLTNLSHAGFIGKTADLIITQLKISLLDEQGRLAFEPITADLRLKDGLLGSEEGIEIFGKNGVALKPKGGVYADGRLNLDLYVTRLPPALVCGNDKYRKAVADVVNSGEFAIPIRGTLTAPMPDVLKLAGRLAKTVGVKIAQEKGQEFLEGLINGQGGQTGGTGKNPLEDVGKGLLHGLLH